MQTRLEQFELASWQKRYVEAARGNDLAAMRQLITQLSTHVCSCTVRSHDSPAFEPGSWQHLCAQAEHESDPEKLLKLITGVNRLLDEERGRKWGR